MLAPQEDQLADSEDLSYPAYGQRLHAFELRDPIAGVTVDSEALDRTAIVTGVSPSVRRSAGSSSDASSASRTAWPRRD